MAAERFVRGPVDREDGLAKAFPSDNTSLRVLGDVTYLFTLHYINSVFLFVLGVY